MRTHQQQKASELQNFVMALVVNAKKADAESAQANAALGIRLLGLMYEQHSQEFMNQTRTYHEQATGLFRGTMPMVGTDIKNYKDEMAGRAKIFEEQRQPQQANLLRVIACICDAIIDPPRSALSTGRACVKAWYAGADYDKIKATAMLLF